MADIINNPNQRKMEDVKNRLVLIGNGFDLALGNKTSYNDFLVWFLKKQILAAYRSGRGSIGGDERVSGYFQHHLVTITLLSRYSNIDENQIKNLNSYKSLIEFSDSSKIDIEPRSTFFKNILKDAGNKGWVDIEDIFYKFLKGCLKNSSYVKDLNENLQTLSMELQEYLKSIQIINKDWSFVSRSITKQFYKPFQKDDFADGNLSVIETAPETICFLNFNYTNSLEKILKHPPRTKTRTGVKTKFFDIQIHGKIDDLNNPIIFGFGDEYDESYKEIENKKDNHFFEHIKSFKYLNTPNYHLLLKFIEAENYQVFIYGHSCGLSDKTMLKHIFEHENCKSIKLFYYKNNEGWDDFENKTMDISRHFDNKGLMRKLIVNKEYSEAIPQYDNENNINSER